MEFSTEFWKSHQKGQQTRTRILAELSQNPHLTVAELSSRCGRCERQIRRQLSTLRLEGDKKILPLDWKETRKFVSIQPSAIS